MVLVVFFGPYLSLTLALQLRQPLSESSAFSQNEAVAVELPDVWHLPYA